MTYGDVITTSGFFTISNQLSENHLYLSNDRVSLFDRADETVITIYDASQERSMRFEFRKPLPVSAFVYMSRVLRDLVDNSGGKASVIREYALFLYKESDLKTVWYADRTGDNQIDRIIWEDAMID